MATKLKITPCNSKVKTSPTEFGTTSLFLLRSLDFNLGGLRYGYSIKNNTM
ncbi:hypothetical protein [Clostridium ihumii]|uniref:hypothetical protein n=1 Tax=Clostridium ihumii TaxID=1470356 RepID=UPI00131575AE|nr:hypothetical protein [Clostridium ihumii]